MFNQRQSEGNILVWDMIERMGVRVRSEDVAVIVRMRKKDGDEAVKPVIIEFKSEYETWTVLRSKSVLREMNEYKNFFRIGFVEKGKREEEREYKRGRKIREERQ